MHKPLGWSGDDHLNTTSALDKVDGPWPQGLVPQPPLGEHGKSRLPVGGVCCTMTDLARWAGSHLPAPKTVYPGTRLLKAETLKKLHELQPGNSTMSWVRDGAEWAKGPVLWHSGATGTWFCLVHLVPDEGYATCVATNYGGENCNQACQAAHLELVKRVPRMREKLTGGRRFLPEWVVPDGRNPFANPKQ